VKGSDGIRGAGDVAGPSAAPFAKCANDYAQDDEFGVVGDDRQMQQQQPIRRSLHYASQRARCFGRDDRVGWVEENKQLQSQIPCGNDKKKGNSKV